MPPDQANPAFPFYLGTAGWTVAKEHAALFPRQGTHLERYATYFSAVEINVTFYRLPKAETFSKWAASVPDNFRFAVKMPRSITHHTRLQDHTLLQPFLDLISRLEDKLGPILIQLPPSLAFAPDRMLPFFTALREQYEGSLVCEPRHPTWFTPEVEQVLTDYEIARVAADPAVVPRADQPGGWPGLAYIRLHGSPKMYYSDYSEAYLQELIGQIRELRQQAPVWCIFDNTASGAAVGNARSVQAALPR